MLRHNVQGEVFAWIDNYLVFAKDNSTADLIMKTMIFWLNHFEIKHKPVDRSGEFLGLKVTDDGIKLSDNSLRRLNVNWSSSEALGPPHSTISLRYQVI